MHAKLAKAVVGEASRLLVKKYRGGVWLPTYFGSRKYCIRPQNLEVANQQFDVSVLRFCISDVVNKHNNCGMRLRLLFSLWLSIISLFADRINKLSNTINKMHVTCKREHYTMRFLYRSYL